MPTKAAREQEVRERRILRCQDSAGPGAAVEERREGVVSVPGTTGRNHRAPSNSSFDNKAGDSPTPGTNPGQSGDRRNTSRQRRD